MIAASTTNLIVLRVIWSLDFGVSTETHRFILSRLSSIYKQVDFTLLRASVYETPRCWYSSGDLMHCRAACGLWTA